MNPIPTDPSPRNPNPQKQSRPASTCRSSTTSSPPSPPTSWTFSFPSYKTYVCWVVIYAVWVTVGCVRRPMTIFDRKLTLSRFQNTHNSVPQHKRRARSSVSITRATKRSGVFFLQCTSKSSSHFFVRLCWSTQLFTTTTTITNPPPTGTCPTSPSPQPRRRRRLLSSPRPRLRPSRPKPCQSVSLSVRRRRYGHSVDRSSPTGVICVKDVFD